MTEQNYPKKLSKSAGKSPRSASRYTGNPKSQVKKKTLSVDNEVEQEFQEIEEQSGLTNTADATEIHPSEEGELDLVQAVGLNEPGALPDNEPLKDFAEIVTEADRLDPILAQDVEIPKNTEELALGDELEDSDNPLKSSLSVDRISP